MKGEILDILLAEVDYEAERLGFIADKILELFQEEIERLRDAILEGQKRWTKGEKAILKIMSVKNLEYCTIHCEMNEAHGKLNRLAREGWEPKFVNCRNGHYYATMVRRKL